MYFSFSSLDIFVIIGYFAIFFGIIYISSRGIKGGKDFKLSDTKFGAFAIMATQGTSMKGAGSLVNVSGGASRNGTGVLASAQAPNIGGWMCVITGMARRLKVTSETKSITSMGDIFYHRFGNDKCRAISTIGPIFVSMSMCASQISAIGMILHMALYNTCGLTFTQGVIIAGAVNLLCTMAGGLKSVVWTDVYQWWVMTPVMFFIIPFFAWQNGATFSTFSQLDAATFFSISPTVSWIPLLISGILSCTVDLVYILRFVSSKDERAAVYGTSTAFFYTSLWAGLAVFLGIAAFIVLPELPSNDQVLYLFAATILPSGVLGLFVGGLLATTISSSDSYLHTAVTTFSSDLFPYFRKGKQALTDRQELILDKTATVVISILSCVLVLYIPALYDLLTYGMSINSVTMFCPVLATLFWRKSEEYGTIAGILGGLISYGIAVKFGWPLPVIIGTVVSGVLVFIIGTFRNINYEMLPGFKRGDSKIINGLSQDTWIALGGIIGCVGGLVFSVGFAFWVNWILIIVGIAIFFLGVYLINKGVPKTITD
ncbi:sodium:solute symporter [uncultured Cloacibacillus sp.]|uniref:sodium:solute symporter family protein n=1 Tax=uncultured Cloacibacillus sp. TaxID=889794 RepID=UPI0026DC174C|nr:sodium:solute symporter family protein [uncultured Cloacibacillus sp.]